MDKRKTRAATQRITRKKTSAPKAARKGPLAEEAVAEIAASPPPVVPEPMPSTTEAIDDAPPETVVALPPVTHIHIEARVPAGEDEPTTRVVFRARPVEAMRPQGWRFVHAFLRRIRSEIETRSAPARAQLTRRFPRLAVLGRLLSRVAA
jgi:hypothetical protein